MKPLAEKIHDVLTEQFSPVALDVTDDSAKHAGHAGAKPGGETHFTVNIVSESFASMNKVARHRAVYAALDPFFKAGLHALALHTKTPAEQ